MSDYLDNNFIINSDNWDYDDLNISTTNRSPMMTTVSNSNTFEVIDDDDDDTADEKDKNEDNINDIDCLSDDYLKWLLENTTSDRYDTEVMPFLYPNNGQNNDDDDGADGSVNGNEDDGQQVAVQSPPMMDNDVADKALPVAEQQPIVGLDMANDNAMDVTDTLQSSMCEWRADTNDNDVVVSVDENRWELSADYWIYNPLDANCASQKLVKIKDFYWTGWDQRFSYPNGQNNGGGDGNENDSGGQQEVIQSPPVMDKNADDNDDKVLPVAEQLQVIVPDMANDNAMDVTDTLQSSMCESRADTNDNDLVVNVDKNGSDYSVLRHTTDSMSNTDYDHNSFDGINAVLSMMGTDVLNKMKPSADYWINNTVANDVSQKFVKIKDFYWTGSDQRFQLAPIPNKPTYELLVPIYNMQSVEQQQQNDLANNTLTLPFEKLTQIDMSTITKPINNMDDLKSINIIDIGDNDGSNTVAIDVVTVETNIDNQCQKYIGSDTLATIMRDCQIASESIDIDQIAEPSGLQNQENCLPVDDKQDRPIVVGRKRSAPTTTDNQIDYDRPIPGPSGHQYSAASSDQPGGDAGGTIDCCSTVKRGRPPLPVEVRVKNTKTRQKKASQEYRNKLKLKEMAIREEYRKQLEKHVAYMEQLDCLRNGLVEWTKFFDENKQLLNYMTEEEWKQYMDLMDKNTKQ
ncbi:uncharacterized protein LOC128957014 [Oppia nitens]|uniref:uncharacterized protein LOC128957014 n=1 Tax=Oppia nitens TaxID=1686743 RepID=UPI0023DB7284|nr:uncharacterized protein LOC128957014 [Oppia nitens]